MTTERPVHRSRPALPIRPTRMLFNPSSINPVFSSLQLKSNPDRVVLLRLISLRQQIIEIKSVHLLVIPNITIHPHRQHL